MTDWLETWAPRVYRFALRLAEDRHRAEDLTQEVLLRAWRHRHQLREQRAASVWLFRIAVNLWRDQLRRGRAVAARPDSLEHEPLDHRPPPVQQMSSQEDLCRALEALTRLPPRQGEVLYLHSCESLSLAEIATVLGISPEAAKASLSLARRRMREMLPDILPQAAPGEHVS